MTGEPSPQPFEPDQPADSRRGRRVRFADRRVQAGAAILVVALLTATTVALTDGSSPKRFSSGPVVGLTTATTELATTPAEVPVDPARFAQGACISFAPTGADRHLTVFLDAGHGGVDPGAVGATSSGRTVEEADLALPVELDAMADLRHAGFTVVVSRTGDTTVDLTAPGDMSGKLFSAQGSHNDVAARDVCANEARADLLVGLYFDAGSSPGNAGSVTGFDAVRPFASANRRFANLLQGDVLSAMNRQGWAIPNDGVLTDNTLGSSLDAADVSYGHLLLLGPAEAGYFTTPSQMPGALIEPLFVTDPFEATIAAATRGQQVIAGGVAAAVEQYFAGYR